MTPEQHIAAEWWQTKSNSPKGAEYADMIRKGGEGYALARGQLDAIIAKGARKGIAAGITASGIVTDSRDKPIRPRKAPRKS